MMKRITPLLLILIANFSWAQNVDYNKIILPKNTQDIELVERLVQIAWQNNPQNDIVRNNVTIAEQNYVKAQAEWLSKFTIGFNLNEFTLNPDNPRSQFYPRYNFGLHFTLGTLVEVPKDKRIAKELVENANAGVNLQKLHIRAEVQRRYEIYKLKKEVSKVQTEATEDANSTYLRTEQKFKNGELDIDDYNKAANYYNSEKIKKLSADSEFQIAKFSLEELLGIKLEEVL